MKAFPKSERGEKSISFDTNILSELVYKQIHQMFRSATRLAHRKSPSREGSGDKSVRNCGTSHFVFCCEAMDRRIPDFFPNGRKYILARPWNPFQYTTLESIPIYDLDIFSPDLLLSTDSISPARRCFMGHTPILPIHHISCNTIHIGIHIHPS